MILVSVNGGGCINKELMTDEIVTTPTLTKKAFFTVEFTSRPE